MGSYPPPPAKLPPGYLPLPQGLLGPSNPYPYPNFREFERGKGQFHSKWITGPKSRRVQFGPPAKQIRPSPYPGDMFWPQGQFKPQKWVTQYAGPDQDFGAGCGCGGSNYGNPMLEGMSLGAKAALAVVAAAAGLALIRRL
jgi:hypothetical protein